MWIRYKLLTMVNDTKYLDLSQLALETTWSISTEQHFRAD